jgi:hypothetical protein
MTEERTVPTSKDEIVAALDSGEWKPAELARAIAGDPEASAAMAETIKAESADMKSTLMRPLMKVIALTLTGLEAATGDDIDEVQICCEHGAYFLDLRVHSKIGMNDDEIEAYRKTLDNNGGIPSPEAARRDSAVQ